MLVMVHFYPGSLSPLETRILLRTRFIHRHRFTKFLWRGLEALDPTRTGPIHFLGMEEPCDHTDNTLPD